MQSRNGTVLTRCAVPAVLPLVALAGCANTTVLSSDNPSRAAPRHRRDYGSLPIEVLGSIPGRSQEQLASLFPTAPGPSIETGRHIVMYVNATRLPAKPDLCSDDVAFRPGGQSGATADVTDALCDGGREITRVSGTVVTARESPRGLVQGFDVIRDQLVQSLYPDANDSFSTSKN